MAPVGKTVMRIHYAIARNLRHDFALRHDFSGDRGEVDFEQGRPSSRCRTSGIASATTAMRSAFHHGGIDRYFPRECFGRLFIARAEGV